MSITAALRNRAIREVRRSALLSSVGSAIAACYALASPSHPHRLALLLVSAFVLALNAAGWHAAGAIAASRWRLPMQLSAGLATIAGLCAVGVLDGGVGTPLGDLLPFYLIFLAVLMPPRAFLLLAAIDLGAYAVVAGSGPPGSLGYPVLYGVGFAVVALLCLQHAGVLVSLRRRLAEISRVDALTGCLNRRGFDERFAAELAGAAQAGTPLTLVLVDLDRFKEINDSYGHRTGDDLLAWVGHTLRDAVRSGDAAGRLGGDEFAVLLPDTGSAEADGVVERLRAALGAVAPASFGTATSVAATTAAELTRLADARLYVDKTSRDRRAPTAAAVAAACAQPPAQAAVRVSRRERRRHSIADTGRVSALKGVAALGYLLVFAADHPHWAAIGLLSSFGMLLGLVTFAAADRLSRSRHAQWVMTGMAFSWYGSAATAAALDGGVSSPLAAGLLCSLPLIMLGTRWRAALPVLVTVCLGYLLMAVLEGAPSAWYVVAHLVSLLAASVACAEQGFVAARRRSLVTRLSERDALTGCLNRRGFTDRFAAVLDEARRSGAQPALLIFDLDEFKKLNDTAGHEAGDDLLRWVGATLQSGVRPDDPVGRLGGDEFVVLVSGDPAGQAERLQRALAVRTPSSVGAATAGRDGTDFDTLYGQADARLYAQKRASKAARTGVPRAWSRTANTT
ncbi:diguanylate cyclase domain-containing protein [Actinoplanes sp. NPDC051859]|uniref:diguanylate cyclase domain-containing protein n=1 Tax=Actinoplanes sp. NPDC051859 TaxID=3363909 RepID=UPI0037B37823